MITEQIYDEMKHRLEKLLKVKITERRISAITTNSRFHWQPELFIKVGSFQSNLEPDAPLEEIIAIFESPIFIVCTPKRGGEGGMPYLFHRQDVTRVELMSD